MKIEKTLSEKYVEETCKVLGVDAIYQAPGKPDFLIFTDAYADGKSNTLQRFQDRYRSSNYPTDMFLELIAKAWWYSDWWIHTTWGKLLCSLGRHDAVPLFRVLKYPEIGSDVCGRCHKTRKLKGGSWQ
jgi:hypothetical protein